MLLCRSLEFIHLSELKVYIKLKNLFFCTNSANLQNYQKYHDLEIKQKRKTFLVQPNSLYSL